MSSNDWNTLKNESKSETGKTWYSVSKIELIGTKWPAAPVTIPNVKIRKKSAGGSWSTSKPSLKIDFQDPNEKVIEETIGTKFLTLNNSIQDPSFMRQCLQNHLCKMTGVPYSRCNHVELFVNESYQGIYVNLEPIEKRFIKNNFRNGTSEGEAKGNLYELQYQYDIKEPTSNIIKAEGPSAIQNCLDFKRAATHIFSNGLSGIYDVIDMAQFYKFWSMELFLIHWDGYTWGNNNTYIYNDVVAVSDPVAGNKSQINLKFIPCGTDQILQTGRSGWNQYYPYHRATVPQKLFDDKWSLNSLHKQVYTDLNTVFDPNMYYSDTEPYLVTMSKQLQKMKEYQTSIGFTEKEVPAWSYDPAELISFCKQAYTDMYTNMLNVGYPFGFVKRPTDRDINTSPVWIDDKIPGNATGSSGSNESWNWVTSPVYSGTYAHQSIVASGMHQHYFDNYYSPPATIKPGAELYTYVYLDSKNMPSQVMLQWNFGGQWARVYWGNSDQIGWQPTKCMGPLPQADTWVRLSVLAKDVPVPNMPNGLENQIVYGMAFTLYNGKATWDCSGINNPVTNHWVDDDLPNGLSTSVAQNNDSWNWVTNPVYSGSKSHKSSLTGGMHQHYFHYLDESKALKVTKGSKLYAYVYLDPSYPPTEVMLQWHDGANWRRASWGTSKIDWPKTNMGALPQKGAWVKLSVPASAVSLENTTIHGMAYTLFDGTATWDAAGVE